jgi:TetR/AcrR family transcriptional repressor of mexJK operon
MTRQPSSKPPLEGEQAAAPRRGRPRDPERLQRILEAAGKHFYAHGFERANVEAIAADAGVSKMTVYSHFASKEGLFEAVIGERTEGVVAARSGMPPLDPLHPEAALAAIGAQFMALTRDEKALGQFRTMYAAAGAQPEACAAFYRQGADRLIGELAAYLRAAHAAGSLRVSRPRQAADLFLALFLGDGHIRGLLKLTPAEPREDKALLREAVRVFIAAYGAAG